MNTADLTALQRQAAAAEGTSYLFGPAGTGKTTALQQRLLRLLRLLWLLRLCRLRRRLGVRRGRLDRHSLRFGREEPEFTWERTDKAAAFKAAA